MKNATKTYIISGINADLMHVAERFGDDYEVKVYFVYDVIRSKGHANPKALLRSIECNVTQILREEDESRFVSVTDVINYLETLLK